MLESHNSAVKRFWPEKSKVGINVCLDHLADFMHHISLLQSDQTSPFPASIASPDNAFFCEGKKICDSGALTLHQSDYFLCVHEVARKIAYSAPTKKQLLAYTINLKSIKAKTKFIKLPYLIL